MLQNFVKYFFFTSHFAFIHFSFFFYFYVKLKKFSNPYYIHEVSLFISLCIITFCFNTSLLCSFEISIYFSLLFYLYYNNYHKFLNNLLKIISIILLAYFILIYTYKICYLFKYIYNNFNKNEDNQYSNNSNNSYDSKGENCKHTNNFDDGEVNEQQRTNNYDNVKSEDLQHTNNSNEGEIKEQQCTSKFSCSSFFSKHLKRTELYDKRTFKKAIV